MSKQDVSAILGQKLLEVCLELPCSEKGVDDAGGGMR